MGSADKVKLSAGSDIADLRKAVKAENAATLRDVDTRNLTVYRNKAAFHAQSLEVDSQLTGLGASMKEAVLVCVVFPTLFSKEFYGIAGVDIHNYLNPQTQGIENVLLFNFKLLLP